MVATMTTTGISTTVNAVMEMGLGGALALVTVLTLLVLVISQDVIIGVEDRERRHWGSSLNVAIVPLAITFMVVATVMITDVLS